MKRSDRRSLTSDPSAVPSAGHRVSGQYVGFGAICRPSCCSQRCLQTHNLLPNAAPAVCLSLKKKKQVQFTLCCSLYVTNPREDFHLLLLFLLLAKGGNGPRRSRWGGGLGCSIKRPAGLVCLSLSTLPG